MNKQFVFILLFVLFPVPEIYSAALNISGDTISPPKDHMIYFAENIDAGESVIWTVNNGLFSFPVGTKSLRYAEEEYIGSGPNLNSVVWDDVTEKGRISYRSMVNPEKYGYADVEILSVVNSQVDSIKAGNFRISSDTIYIPNGEFGSVKCNAYMIFPVSKGGSNTPVKRLLCGSFRLHWEEIRLNLKVR